MRYLFILFALPVLFYNSISCAQDVLSIKTMTIGQAINYALVNNPELQSQAKNVDLANENIDLALSGYRPTVNLTGGVVHYQTDNDIVNNWSGSTEKVIRMDLAQPLFRGGQTVSNVEQQEILKTASENIFSRQTQDKIVEIVDVYMATYRAFEAMGVNADNVKLLQEQLNATEARFEAGELTKTDVSQAKARVAQAIAEETEAKAVYNIALSGFREVTGIQDDIDLVYPEIDWTDVPENLDSALAIGLRKNPDIIAAVAQIEAQDAKINEDKGAFYPQLSLDAGVNLERDPAFSQLDEQKSANVGLTATLPIYQAGILRNSLRQSHIIKAQRQNDLEAAQRAVNNNIISAWENYKATALQIEAREAQLEASKLAYEGVNLEEQVGARSILDVLDANQDIRDAELSLIESRSNRVSAYYSLLSAMGILNQSLWDNSETML